MVSFLPFCSWCFKLSLGVLGFMMSLLYPWAITLPLPLCTLWLVFFLLLVNPSASSQPSLWLAYMYSISTSNFPEDLPVSWSSFRFYQISTHTPPPPHYSIPYHTTLPIHITPYHHTPYYPKPPQHTTLASTSKRKQSLLYSIWLILFTISSCIHLPESVMTSLSEESIVHMC